VGQTHTGATSTGSIGQSHGGASTATAGTEAEEGSGDEDEAGIDPNEEESTDDSTVVQLLRQQLQQQQQQQQQIMEQQQMQQQMMLRMMDQLDRLQGQRQPVVTGPSMMSAPIAASMSGSGAASVGGTSSGVRRALQFAPASGHLGMEATDGKTDPEQKATASVGTGAGGPTGGRVKKLLDLDKLPAFYGEMDSDKLDVWLRKLMNHCLYYGDEGEALEEEKAKVKYASAHLEGAAADWWFTSMAGRIKTIQEFVEAVNGRFRSAVDEDVAAEKLYRLRQQKGQPVSQYVGLVQQLLLRIPDMAMKDRVRLFARGLLPHLAQKVREMRPDTLEKAAELAIRYEGSFETPGGKLGGAGGSHKLNTVEAEGEGEEGKKPDTTAEQNKLEATAKRMELVLAAMQKWQPQGGAGTQGRPQATAERSKNYCFRCGDRRHMMAACTFEENVCFNCKEPGHVRRECPKKGEGKEGAKPKK